MTGGVFLHAEFFAPWCVGGRVAPELCAPAVGPASHLIIYHYVVEGDLRIRVEGEVGDDVVIAAGELVLLPRNDPHLMGSDLSLPPVFGEAFKAHSERSQDKLVEMPAVPSGHAERVTSVKVV